MSFMSLWASTLKQVRDAIRKDSSAAAALLKDLETRVGQVESRVNAYVHFDSARSHEEAAQLKGSAASEKPLWGVPVAVKDNICTRGWETTCGSKILKGHVPFYDATVVRKLREAGALLFAKCNMDEFAFGSSTESSCYGPTRNPWDLERVPGGSSGGSAAAVAADESIASLGSDTGGSIRQPASFCGVVGLKPTYGRVSRYGLVAFGSSLDQIGPLTKTVEDSAMLLNVMAGHDPLDSTSANVPCPDYTKALRSEVKGLKIGLPEEYFISGLDKRVEAAVKQAAQQPVGLPELPVEPERPLPLEELVEGGFVGVYLEVRRHPGLQRVEPQEGGAEGVDGADLGPVEFLEGGLGERENPLGRPLEALPELLEQVRRHPGLLWKVENGRRRARR